MTTTTRKQTRAQARKSALESDYTPLYAFAGLTQVLASTLQSTTNLASARAGEQLAAWQEKREQQAKATADDLSKLVRTLPDQVKALPSTTKAQVAEWQRQVTEWQKQAAEFVGAANSAYAELAGRGKVVVDETIGTARRFGNLAEKRAADVAADAADTVDPAFEAVQESVVRARQNVTGRTATESVTPRSSQRAAATRARNAATRTVKTSPAKKASVKNTAKTTTSTAKTTAKTTAKKAVKSPARKTTAKATTTKPGTAPTVTD